MIRVKVCGLMNENDLTHCVQAGVHTLGFVVEFPVSVPWNLTRNQAKELIQAVPPFVNTCIVTGGAVEKVVSLAKKTRPNVVQLHYEETLEDVTTIARELREIGIKTIKALRIDSEGKCKFDIDDPTEAAQALSKSGVSAILVDSYTESMPGGTGVMVDLTTFQTIQQSSALPVILAGGLNPDNVQSIVRDVNPFAVDVLTGVEAKHGEKDASKIKAFMLNVNKN
ncbi:phosphoribosylanthranilate isomerase [Pueribacillus sp. YX66]|uniref:phosphoribosylanthranilate isomerase n=1 Tax=Pueribacillus sp. YX66 TaxID=3229242 RepID=UPI00358CF918